MNISPIVILLNLSICIGLYQMKHFFQAPKLFILKPRCLKSYLVSIEQVPIKLTRLCIAINRYIDARIKKNKHNVCKVKQHCCTILRGLEIGYCRKWLIAGYDDKTICPALSMHNLSARIPNQRSYRTPRYPLWCTWYPLW